MSTLINDKQAYLNHCELRHFKPKTIERSNEEIDRFINWCADRDIHDSQSVTRQIVEAYQRFIQHYKKADGNHLKPSVQAMRIGAVRLLFQWLSKHHHILYNPAAEIELPKYSKKLPKNILTQSEVERVINQPDTDTILGLRDRAILEVLYSTGIRRQELINLKLTHVDSERGTLMIENGKGNKDRVVPIGDRAMAWVTKYIHTVRDQHSPYPDTGYLFYLTTGNPMSQQQLTKIARDTIKAAGIKKQGACHLLRHTMATLMLENGADVRHIQAILGHQDLSTTQIYTQVSIKKIKEIHTKTHPARMHRVNAVQA